jgi:hypothetical protein
MRQLRDRGIGGPLWSLLWGALALFLSSGCNGVEQGSGADARAEYTNRAEMLVGPGDSGAALTDTPDGGPPAADAGAIADGAADVGSPKACQMSLHKTALVYCAARPEGGKLLALQDDYVAALSPFDRSFLTQTEGSVTTAQVLTYLSQQALDWTPAEAQLIKGILGTIDARLAPFSFGLPTTIPLVKVSSQLGPPHTRMSFVVLPESALQKSTSELETLLTHELFHIISRHDAALRKKLYGIIGFTAVAPLSYPKELADLKLTNPDTPILQHAIQLQYSGTTYDFVPITYASQPYSQGMGSNPFSVLTFKLLGVQTGANTTAPLYWNGGQGPLFTVDVNQLPAFYQKVGQNTQYVIHPDEILADNFALLVGGKNSSGVQSPQLLAQIAQAL